LQAASAPRIEPDADEPLATGVSASRFSNDGGITTGLSRGLVDMTADLTFL
jgi:hypothetical protein